MRDRRFKSYPRNHFKLLPVVPDWKSDMSLSTGVYRVYVIQNADGKIYIGMTEDVEVRLTQHNEGVSKWTKHRGPWTLRWTSEAMSITEARKLENELKRQKGGDGFYRITGLVRSSGS